MWYSRTFCEARTAFLSPRPQAEETEKPSELSKRCEKHILIQAGRQMSRSSSAIHDWIFLKIGIRMEMIGGHQNIDLYKIWAKGY